MKAYDKGMYWNDIREIISKCYTSRESRYLYGGKSESNPVNGEYYYNPEKLESVSHVISLIENGEIHEDDNIGGISFQLKRKTKNDGTHDPFMLKLYETDTYYLIVFNRITGYCVTKENDGRMAIKLSYIEHPFLRLIMNKEYGSIYQQSIGGSVCSFGFSGSINRELISNKSFCLFFVELLYRMGEVKYIFKDIARLIKADHFCLISEPLEEIGKYHNPESLIRGITHSHLRMNYNKKNINYAYFITKMAGLVREGDIGKLMSVDEKTVMRWISSRETIEEVIDGEWFVKKYYEHLWGE